MEQMTKKEMVALAALQGMLAHPTRYKPRPQDADLTFHEAICREAFDIATEFVIESSRR
jgi:hypothetical protein